MDQWISNGLEEKGGMVVDAEWGRRDDDDDDDDDYDDDDDDDDDDGNDDGERSEGGGAPCMARLRRLGLSWLFTAGHSSDSSEDGKKEKMEIDDDGCDGNNE